VRTRPKGAWLDIAVKLLNPFGRIFRRDELVENAGYQFTDFGYIFRVQKSVGARAFLKSVDRKAKGR